MRYQCYSSSVDLQPNNYIMNEYYIINLKQQKTDKYLFMKDIIVHYLISISGNILWYGNMVFVTKDSFWHSKTWIQEFYIEAKLISSNPYLIFIKVGGIVKIFSWSVSSKYGANWEYDITVDISKDASSWTKVRVARTSICMIINS